MTRRPVPPLPASNWLIPGKTLVILPKLAARIGLNEAIVLNQVRYWLEHTTNVRDGRRWVYNTYEEWQRNDFPFWSVPTVKRVFQSLEKSGLLLSTAQYNQAPTDRTKWYTIDFARLNALDAPPTDENVRPLDQVDPFDGSSRSDGTDQADPLEGSERSAGQINLGRSYQRDRTEITTQNTQEKPIEESKREPRAAATDDNQEAMIRRVIRDFSVEFLDLDHVASNCTRALNLWRHSDREGEDFVDELQWARRTTREWQGRQPPGKRIESKMAYFFAVLEDRLGLRGEREGSPNAKPARTDDRPTVRFGQLPSRR